MFCIEEDFKSLAQRFIFPHINTMRTKSGAEKIFFPEIFVECAYTSVTSRKFVGGSGCVVTMTLSIIEILAELRKCKM